MCQTKLCVRSDVTKWKHNENKTSSQVKCFRIGRHNSVMLDCRRCVAALHCVSVHAAEAGDCFSGAGVHSGCGCTFKAGTYRHRAQRCAGMFRHPLHLPLSASTPNSFQKFACLHSFYCNVVWILYMICQTSCVCHSNMILQNTALQAKLSFGLHKIVMSNRVNKTATSTCMSSCVIAAFLDIAWA